jgi:hypothetical protein
MSIRDLVLPEISEDLEVGLAVGVDPALADNGKLPILVGAGVTADAVLQNCVIWALLNQKINSFPENLRLRIYNGIAGAFKTDLVRYRSSAVAGEPFDEASMMADRD